MQLDYNKENGKIKAWYYDDQTAPEGSINISEEDYNKALLDNANHFNGIDTFSIVDFRPLDEQLQDAKENKKLEFKESKVLVIDSKTFSTSRIDIQKYKEATDIRENANETTVILYVLEGKIEINIADARSIIKTLSEKAYNDFCTQKDFQDDVDACTTIEEVTAIAVPVV